MGEEKYSLVLFVEDSEKNIDIVPSDWIVHNKIDDNLYCKFIDESQAKNVEISKLLWKKVKNLENPGESCKFHRVDVRGRAEAVVLAKSGTVNPILLSPDVLMNAINLIRNEKGNDRMPIPISNGNYFEYLEVSEVVITIIEYRLVYILKIPILDPIDERYLKDCKTHKKRYFCKSIFPKYYIKAHDASISKVVNSPAKLKEDDCNIKMVSARHTVWIQFKSNDKWLYCTVAPEIIKIICNNKVNNKFVNTYNSYGNCILDCSPFNQSRKKTISTRSCLKNDDTSKSSGTSIESNATLKIDKQQNIHNLSSSDEQDIHLTTKIIPTNTANEKSYTCWQETSELVLKEFRKLFQQLGTLHGLAIEMSNELQQIRKNKFSGYAAPKERVRNIQVPFTTLNEFDTFDDALKDNSSLKRNKL
ncbi:hypothetical protein PV326_011511 [Microctonus aethiopoides]|nr:hypothetical protein PV326_011511 [Microctonus aethiopoides]